MTSGKHAALALVLAMIHGSFHHALATSSDVDPHTMTLTLLTDFAKSRGSVCLDGSPGGFYFREATDPAHKNDWVLHFKGAGWCYDIDDCYRRSQMEFGSSKLWPNTTNGWSAGLLSPNDPTFGGYNKVILLYCDGASFTGNRTDPVPVSTQWQNGAAGAVASAAIAENNNQGTSLLYFRGLRIRDAILDTLVQDHGLSNAENVLLTGCSSGGLAAYIHSEAVKDKVAAVAPHLKKFRVAPVSGFFLQHNSLQGLPVYPDQMRNIFTLSNSSGGVNSKCAAARSADRQWECMFAQNSFAVSSVPTFIENSAMDAWQTTCIFTAGPMQGFPNHTNGANGNCSGIAAYRDCGRDLDNCTADQTKVMNSFQEDYVATLTGLSAFHAAGNGAFIHSCHTHCNGIAGGWKTYHIRNVSMAEAVYAWWQSDGKDPAATHTYLPCTRSVSNPHGCNPTCLGN